MLQKKRCILSVLLLIIVATSFGQQKTVTGIIRDAEDKPIPSATVQEKGTTNTVTADTEGSFRISVKSGATLVFTSVGFSQQSIKPGNSSSLNVKLESSTKDLSEVVVTALGIKREKKALGYSVVSINTEKLENIGSPLNTFTSLYGQVPGLQLSSTALGPAGGLSIKIRNAVALQQGTSTRPLIVMDGIPMLDGNIDNIDRSSGNGLNDLNINDIETFEVLKGAKASVLYGAKGSGGVILITTKSGGKKKGLGVDMNVSSSIESPWIQQEFQNEFGSGFPSAWNNPGFQNEDGFYLRNGVEAYYPSQPYNFGPRLDGRMILWYDSVMRPYVAQPNNIRDMYRNGSTNIANVAIQGGNNQGSFRFSYSHNDYKGIFEGFKVRNDNFSFNGNMKITERVNLKLASKFITTFNHNSPSTNQDPFVTYGTPRQLDINLLKTQVLDAETGYFWWTLNNRATRFPVGRVSRDNLAGNYFFNQWQNSYDNYRNHFINSLTMNIELTKGLTLDILGGFDWIDNKNETKERLRQPLSVGAGGSYSIARSTDVAYNGQAILSYTTKFGKNFGLYAYAGGVIQRNTSEYLRRFTQGGFITRDWFSLSNSKLDPRSESSRGNDRLYGALASAQLSFKEWLFFEVQGRNDWSSIQPAESNSYFYPGASISWIASQALKLPSWVNYAKLRVGFADLGLPGPRYFGGTTYGIGNYGGVISYSPPGDLPAANLTNERRRELEIGIETKFFQNRLGFEFNYYHGNWYDQIMGLSISPASFGGGAAKVNAGEIVHNGLEMMLTGTPIRTKDFQWIVTLNASRDKPINKKLAPGITQQNLWGAQGASVVAKEGEPWGQIVISDFKRDARTGQPIVGGDGLYSNDATKPIVVGKVLPDIGGGINNTISYKDFSLDFNIDAQFGSTLVSQTNLYMIGNGSAKNTVFGRDEASGGLPYYVNNSGAFIRLNSHDAAVPADSRYTFIMHDGVILDGVKEDGTKNDIIITAADKYAYYWRSFLDIQPDVIFKNDYIKLRNVVLSYSLPKAITAKLKLDRLSFSVFASNLLYLYKTMPNVDAEAINGTNAFYENNAFPTARSYGVSIRAGF